MHLAIPAILAAAVLATSARAEVVATDAWARASLLPSRPGVAYLTLESSEADRLVSAETPAARAVSLHGNEAGADGINRMDAVDGVALPAGRAVVLKPGGTHLMLMGLTRRLTEGESFPLSLSFESGARIDLEVPVLGIAAAGPAPARD